MPVKAHKKVDIGSHQGADIDHMQRYEEERKKRIRPEGPNQYIDLRRSERFKSLLEDPWIEDGELINTPVSNGGHVKVLIVRTMYPNGRLCQMLTPF